MPTTTPRRKNQGSLKSLLNSVNCFSRKAWADCKAFSLLDTSSSNGNRMVPGMGRPLEETDFWYQDTPPKRYVHLK